MPSLEDAYKLARKNLEAKFIISLIAQLTSIWLAHTKQLDGALWVYFTLGNIAAYGAIETGQQIIAARTATKLAKGET